MLAEHSRPVRAFRLDGPYDSRGRQLAAAREVALHVIENVDAGLARFGHAGDKCVQTDFLASVNHRTCELLANAFASR